MLQLPKKLNSHERLTTVVDRIMAMEKAENNKPSVQWQDVLSFASQIKGIHSPLDLVDFIEKQIATPEVSVKRKVELDKLREFLKNNRERIEKIESEL